MGKKTRNQDVKTKIDSSMFGTESIGKILLHTAPPVMLAQLIQALYNIVDSYFVGKFSANGLTALSVIFPVQLVITALAIGIGVGVNTLMARQYAQNESEAADKTAGTGLVLTVACWALFTLLAMALLRPNRRKQWSLRCCMVASAAWAAWAFSWKACSPKCIRPTAIWRCPWRHKSPVR